MKKGNKILTVFIAVFAVMCLVLLIFTPKPNPETNEHWYSRSYATGLTEEEHYPCLRWAFGEDYLNLRGRDVPDAWNQRHSDIFIIYGSDEYYETFARIGEAYKKLN